MSIFQSGTHRGKAYTERDLDQMVDNFQRFSSGPKPKLRVPAVLGHDESQEFLERSDLPAAAWPSRIWRVGDKLKADFDDVPPKVARLIKGKAYRTVSSEVYDEPPEGIEGKGRMLRRVAFLGGDIPQIKTLDEIPVPEDYAEGGRFASWRPCAFQFSEMRRMPSGAFAVFSEVKPMDRAEMLQALAGHGIDTTVFTGAVPDSVLAEMLRICDDKDSRQPRPEDEPAPEPENYDDEEMPDSEGMSEDEMGMMRERSRKYFERARKFADAYCGKGAMKKWAEEDEDMSRPTTDDQGKKHPKVDPEKEAKAALFSEASLAALVASEVAKAVARTVGETTKEDLKSLQTFREETLLADKRRSVGTVLDRLGKEGKVPPSLVPHYTDLLLRADARAVVEKFTEKTGKKVELTAFDKLVRDMEKLPTLFREGPRSSASRGGASPPPGQQPEEDAEVQAVEAHFESYSERFAALGTSKDDLVKTYKYYRKQDRELTAEKFLERSSGRRGA